MSIIRQDTIPAWEEYYAEYKKRIVTAGTGGNTEDFENPV